MEEKTVIVIFDQYGHDHQPFLRSWFLNLKEQSSSVLGIANKIVKDEFKGELVEMPEIQKGEYIKRAVRDAFLEKTPFFSFITGFKQNNTSLLRKLQFYAIYKPLLNLNPRLIHLINAQQYFKYKPIFDYLRIPIIVSFRGFDISVRPGSDSVWKSQLMEIFQQSHKLHFVSHYLQKEAVTMGAPKEKCLTLYRSVDTDFYSPTEKKETNSIVKILSVGRLTWQKGYVYTLEAMKIIKKNGGRFIYQIIGDGNEINHLIFQINRLGLQNEVKLLGSLPSDAVKKYLDDADIFLQASVSDALPNSILEASSMARPIVGTKVGGIPEAVKDNETGLLIDAGNPAKIAEALMNLINDPSLRISLGNEGRKYMLSNFSKAKEFENWNHLYNC